jgi:hypothetical protein
MTEEALDPLVRLKPSNNCLTLLSSLVVRISGKNAVHLLHPIFGLGRDEHAGKSPYQIAASEARRREGSTADASSSIPATDGGVVDEDGSTSRRTRSLQRKDSVKRRLESGACSPTRNSTKEKGRRIKD